MNTVIQKFISNLTQSLNTILGNIFRNSQGDILDVFNPMSFLVNFTVEGILFILLLITFPIFCSGIYVLSKRKGLKLSLLSFVPGFHVYYLGKLAGEVNVLSKKIKAPHRILIFLYIINYLPVLDALDFIPFLGSVIEAFADKAYYIMLMVTIHRVYEIYTPKKADSLIIIGIPFQFLNAFFMYKIRKNSPVNSKLVLDYDFDGVYDEDVTLHNQSATLNASSSIDEQEIDIYMIDKLCSDYDDINNEVITDESSASKKQPRRLREGKFKELINVKKSKSRKIEKVHKVKANFDMNKEKVSTISKTLNPSKILKHKSKSS